MFETNDDYDIIINEIEAFEDQIINQIARKFESLKDRVKERTGQQLVSARIAAETANLSESAIRQAGRRGTINKYNADGSKKVDSSKRSVFYDLNEVFDRMHPKRQTG